MRRIVISLFVLCAGMAPAQAQQPIVAASKSDQAATRFGEVLGQALGTLAQSRQYALDVESVWGAVGDADGPKGGSRYKLLVDGRKYRVEVQSKGAAAPELVCVCDGVHVTTWFPARKLYAQHDADSPQAGIGSNKMLAMSLQGSAIDIMLQPDVVGFVRTQATEVQDRGLTKLGDVSARHFAVYWDGADVELWFAADGPPLLLQFTRTTCVPQSDNDNYEMACTAKFSWKLGQVLPKDSFAIALPDDARQVNEIYAALAGEESASRLDKPLPKLQLAKLDGTPVELAAAEGSKATVLIFWATWNTASVEDLPAVSQFVKAYKDRGVAFYAVNVGEAPGTVRRFAAESPLQSTILLDPRGRASSALRVTDLPAVAVVGPDNNVRAILHGTSKALQGELTEQLESLLSTSAPNTARRPGEQPK